MKKVLLKDIVIPAGTIFSDAPTKTVRSGQFIDVVFSLSKDTYGTAEYCLDDFGEDVNEWFGDIAGVA